MKAAICVTPAPISTNPLDIVELNDPVPAPDEILVRVRACGVCHTDLHVIEGELLHTKFPIIPGHQIVGVVEALGSAVDCFTLGNRVGIPWLHRTDGTCSFCDQGLENLCEGADFTGYTVDGGYAELATVPATFAVHIPDAFSDVNAAPLLCAGIVGYRSLRMVGLRPGECLGIFGFGAAGHLAIQIALYWGCEVYVFTRGVEHQQYARELGALWAGNATDLPPHPVDRAIIFAPAGEVVPLALGHLRKAGTLCLNAIHMSDIPTMPYSLLWHERTIHTVANATRKDAEEFLPLAAEISLKVATQTFSLEEVNDVLNQLKRGEITGAAVFQIS